MFDFNELIFVVSLGIEPRRALLGSSSYKDAAFTIKLGDCVSCLPTRETNYPIRIIRICTILLNLLERWDSNPQPEL